MPPLLRWMMCAVATTVLACGGGGGDNGGGGAGPVAVASVQITASAGELEVGSSLATTVTLTDAKGNVLSGRAVAYASSANAIATVDNFGTVTGVSAGNVTITATAEGKSGTLALAVQAAAVSTISIEQRTPAVRQGETITLTVKTFDRLGREVTGRAITWSSANTSTATVSAAGVVAGVTPGQTFIRAVSEGKSDSVSLRVRSLLVPSIAATAPATWTPGGAATIDGANFSLTPGDNEVLVNGARAAVTAASGTRLTITVPAVTQLPCSPTGPVPITVVVGGDSALGSANLQMATARTLAVGQSLLLTAQNDLLCNEFAVTGGVYLLTAFNYAASPADRRDVSLLGATAGTPPAAQIALRAADIFAGTPGFAMPQEIQRRLRRQELHVQDLERQRSFLAARRNPIREARARRARMAPDAVRLSLAAAPVPNVGDMLSLRMRTNFTDFRTFETVRARVVYVGPKMIILEDSLAPLARTMDADYVRLGQEFDSQMYGFVGYFGDPLAVDSLTDNNGHLFAVFSRRVNGYLNGNILGFVTICDFFENTGPPDQICPSSNVGEYFYAIVPDPNATNGLSVDLWRRFMRGTLIHEAKHIASYAERLLRDTEELEESWLEEATAQQASEVWARSVYSVVWKGDAGWNDGPRCDYAQIGGACADPVEGVLGHFVWLYQYYDVLGQKSILSRAQEDGAIYGSSWSFARWVTDAHATDEARFLRSLTQVKNDHGIANIAGKSGRPYFELLGNWSLATLADNYPGAILAPDTKLQLHSWNSRDLFQNMHQFLRFSDGRVAFPKAFPLTIRQVTFGTWPQSLQEVRSLAGGSFAAWEVTGVQTKPQVIALRAIDGAIPPSDVGLAIVRVR